MAMPCPFNEKTDRQLKAICRLKPSLKDASAFLELTEDQIEKYCRRKYKKTWSEFRDQNMVHTRFMVIRKILEQCERGNTAMLIFTAKNLCGWRDKFDTDPEEIKKIVLNYKLEEPKIKEGVHEKKK